MFTKKRNKESLIGDDYQQYDGGSSSFSINSDVGPDQQAAFRRQSSIQSSRAEDETKLEGLK